MVIRCHEGARRIQITSLEVALCTNIRDKALHDDDDAQQNIFYFPFVFYMLVVIRNMMMIIVSFYGNALKTFFLEATKKIRFPDVVVTRLQIYTFT
jgi:hypothetical protein